VTNEIRGLRNYRQWQKLCTQALACRT